jgi:hypothetical protein
MTHTPSQIAAEPTIAHVYAVAAALLTVGLKLDILAAPFITPGSPDRLPAVV